MKRQAMLPAAIALVASLSLIGDAWAIDLPRNVTMRGSLQNSRVTFENTKTGRVAFMGGSITEMHGYRPMVAADLQAKFPGTKFTFTNAGISSTCSTTGSFRLDRDVLSKGPIDLFFVEFAVNDDQDAAHATRECLRGMEGILRHCRQANPQMDVVVVYFCNPGMVEKLSQGDTPVSIAAHEKAAQHYAVPSVNLAREVAQQISEETLTWKQFGGTHPGPRGNRLAADMVKGLLEKAWEQPLPADARTVDHPLPQQPLDKQSYFRGRFIQPSEADFDDTWTWHQPNWKAIRGSFRATFANEKLLTCDSPNATLTLPFDGRAIGVYVLAGPDAGVVEASIDGGPFQAFDLYHRFSRGLHYPRTVMLAAGLEPGKHTLRLRIVDHQKEGRGNAVRILQFAVN